MLGQVGVPNYAPVRARLPAPGWLTSVYCWFSMGAISIHAVVVTHIDRDDLFILDQQLQGDAIGEIDGNRMHALQSATQGVQTKGGVEGVGLQQRQRFEVLLA